MKRLTCVVFSIPLSAILAVSAPQIAAAAVAYTITDLGTLGGTSSFGGTINNLGQVTGQFYLTGNAAAHAFLYDGTMHDLGTLGGTNSGGLGINDAGQIVGSSFTTGNNASHAFLHDGTIHDLGTLGGLNSTAYGINNHGQITGYANTPENGGQGFYRAFLYDGTMHDLGTLGGTNSYGGGVNNLGQVTGDSDTTSNFRHAFLYDGTMHDLGTLGGSSSFAGGINNLGQAIGYSYTTGNVARHAFLYDGTMHDLGALGDFHSQAAGINDHGQVVGRTSTMQNSPGHAFIYDSAHGMVDLNSLIDPGSGWSLVSAGGINNVGQIAGWGSIGGQTHAFVLTPVPEPSAFVLATLGFVGLMVLRQRRRATCAAIVLSTLCMHASDARAVTIDWSPVGNPGNANDPATGNLYGGVAYNYKIGTYDVTNSQYAEFLNTKDPSGANTLGLWNSNMADATVSGISFNGGNLPGSKYVLTAGHQNHPVNYVDWYDTIRFANWLNNGQGSGDTESGAYTLLGGTPTPSNGNSITRNAGATVFLPSESEWYKAAYYAPGTSSYFEYATSTNSTPIASGPTGLANHVNYNYGVGNLTDVGAYSGTTSPYGAFDMNGNVWQWNEALISGSSRELRGASYFDGNSGNLRSSLRAGTDPTVESRYFGFRVATVPEPSTFVLAALGILGLLVVRKRRLSNEFLPRQWTTCRLPGERPARDRMQGLARLRSVWSSRQQRPSRQGSIGGARTLRCGYVQVRRRCRRANWFLPSMIFKEHDDALPL